MRRHDEGKTKGEKDRVVVWAGQGVGLTKEIKGTEEVVRTIHEETVAQIRRVSALLVSA